MSTLKSLMKRLFEPGSSSQTTSRRRRHNRRGEVQTLEIRQLLAADFQLIKDISTAVITESSEPRDFTSVGAVVYFTASDSVLRGTSATGTQGRELWRTNGTYGGTVLVKDIFAGPSGSEPSSLTNFNGVLYFTARDAQDGRELWKSNGTAGGTVKVASIGSGSLGSDPTGLINVNGVLYFTANNGVNGPELWKSDGTASGTVLVKDIRPGASGSSPSGFASLGGVLYFSADDGANGIELWKSNGTAAGTVLVKSINPGPASAFVSGLTEMEGSLYFSASDATHGNELWKTDGTSDGTVMVKDLTPGSTGTGIASLVNLGGTLLFRAFRPGLYVERWDLWKSDGTEAGTSLIKVMGAEHFTSSNIVNGVLYFSGEDETTGFELWKSDGTISGTVLVKDLWPGQYYYFFTNEIGEFRRFNGRPEGIQNLNGTLYFTANDGVHGREVWKSDGTAAGTTLLKDIAPSGWTGTGPSALASVNGALYFSADDSVHGTELWRSTGTNAGTTLIRDLAPNLTNRDSQPSDLIEINGITYFVADDGIHGRELWRSDGTTAGTRMMKDIRTGAPSSAPSSLTNVNGVLYFAADDGSAGHRGYAPGAIGSGRELWRTDGTTAGTVLVANISTGYYFYEPPNAPPNNTQYELRPNNANPSDLTNFNGTLFFTATNGQSGHIPGGPTYGTGRELWKTDGTVAGTVLVKDIRPGVYSSYAHTLTLNNGLLYFSAYDGLTGFELWKSDGTTAGTSLVKNIRTGSADANPGNFTNVNGLTFFTANDGSFGTELWKTDGTTAGTVRVADVYSGRRSSSPASLTNVNGTLYFAATSVLDGRELWKSDGTAAGTIMVKNIQPGAAGGLEGFDPSLENLNGTLYFVADDLVNGREIWRSDGTSAGTRLVTNLASGAAGSEPGRLTSLLGQLYFTANNGIAGPALWRTDGTAAGMQVLRENFLGRLKNSPGSFLISGNLLYAVTEQDPFGIELFVHNLTRGTSSDDLFIVKYLSTTTGGSVSVTRNTAGQASVFIGTFPMSQPLKIDGGGGNDSIRILGTSHDDTLVADATGFTINGSRLTLTGIENTLLSGLSGDDVYRFDPDTPLGTFTIDESFGGVDTIDLSAASGPVTLNLGQGYSQEINSNLRLKLSSGMTVERAIGGAGNDTLAGNSLNNLLQGNGGNDILLGGAGNDIYEFGNASAAETDKVIEGSDTGVDTLRFSSVASPISINLGTVASQVVQRNRTLILNTRLYIENIIGGSADDRLIGNGSANLLQGGDGNDVLIGGAGNDSLMGGNGGDTYIFETAATPESDTVTEGAGGGADMLSFRSVSSSVNLDLGSAVLQTVHTNRTLRLNSRSNFENAAGGSGNDVLRGNAASNVLVGNAGNDQILGLGGRDILIGGAGLDSLDGGDDDDILIAGRTTSDAVDANLNGLSSLWNSAGSYVTRITGMRRGSGLPPVSLKAQVNVLNDAGQDDRLSGANGIDWFLLASDDLALDKVHGELADLL